MKANVRPASEDQLDELRIGVVKSFDKLRGSLGADVAQGWIGNSLALDRLMEGLISPESTVPAEPPKPELLLELVNSITLAATTKKFVAKDRFVVDTSCRAKVKISGIGDNFDNWFLAGDGRVEDPIGQTDLRSHKLLKYSVDGPIITELGGIEMATTGLTHAFSLMEKQPNSPDSNVGPLLVNGWWNILYVPQAVTKLDGNRFSYINKKGKTITDEVSNPAYLFEINSQWMVLRAVSVHWSVDGWFVIARSVESPDGWFGGARVFSRNFVLKPMEPVPAAS